MTMRRRRSPQKRAWNEVHVARRRYVTPAQKVLFTGEAFLGNGARAGELTSPEEKQTF